MKSKSNAEETECSCNHLTHFAVLFDYSDANSRVRCTPKTTEPWNWLECFCVEESTHNNTSTGMWAAQREKKMGVVDVQNFELFPRFGNICSNPLLLGSEVVTIEQVVITDSEATSI